MVLEVIGVVGLVWGVVFEEGVMFFLSFFGYICYLGCFVSECLLISDVVVNYIKGIFEYLDCLWGFVSDC